MQLKNALSRNHGGSGSRKTESRSIFSSFLIFVRHDTRSCSKEIFDSHGKFVINTLFFIRGK